MSTVKLTKDQLLRLWKAQRDVLRAEIRANSNAGGNNAVAKACAAKFYQLSRAIINAEYGKFEGQPMTSAAKLLKRITEDEKSWKVQFLDAEGHEGLQTVHADSQADAAAIAKRSNPEIRSIQSVELDPDSAFGGD